MKRKEYDDDLLIDSLARPDVSYSQAAQRLGLSVQYVRRIAKGRFRPELQPRIRRRRRCWARRAERQAQRAAAEPLEKPRASFHLKDYDENLLVDLIARNDLRTRQIARRVGLSASMVRRIAAGSNRPDLQPRIEEARQHYARQVRRAVTRELGGLIRVHVRNGKANSNEYGRKCREWVMNKAWEETAPREAKPAQPDPLELVDLSPELKRMVLAELGGPQEDQGEAPGGQ